MKMVSLLLLLPVFCLGQAQSCAKTSLLYSRELFPGNVSVARAAALSGFDAECREVPQTRLTFPKVRTAVIDTYQFYPLDVIRQDITGRDLFLGVIADQLVNHLIYDRR